ncbi:MAG: ECF transporter S component [Clostridium sp.]|uniref:ECF transporter S component n=1 Tax=Clostridium sp. TaxID=1506 RepID=UPI002FCADF5D
MQNVKSNYKNILSVRKIVFAGVFSSVSIFLGITGLGFIHIPPVFATILHIPVIIAAIVEGPIVGIIVGGIFGLFSMYQAVTAPTITSFIFLNPIIALVPRILIGVTSYYTYTLLNSSKFMSKYKKISIGVSAAVGTLTNTILVLSLAFILYGDNLASAMGVESSTIGYTLLGIGATNGIPETIISTLICIPVVIAVSRLQK